MNPEKFQTQALSLESLQSGWKAETRSSERSDTPRCHHSDQGKGERFRLHRDILAGMPRDSFWERGEQLRYKSGVEGLCSMNFLAVRKQATEIG